MNALPIKFLTDADIARILGMSRSWVRKERFNRHHGLPHSFDLDAIYFGSSPRYRTEEVLRWCEGRAAQSSTSTKGGAR